MAETPRPILTFGTHGMNSAVDTLDLPESQVARAVNLRIHKKRWGTRPGAIALPLDGPESELASFRNGNLQGCLFYNPARGQGARSFGQDFSRLMASSGGSRFSLAIKGDERSPRAVLKDVSGGLRTKPRDFHFWCQAENYAICSDGVGSTWIWDGVGNPFLSQGYNTVSPDAARVPNAAGPMCYAHNMLHVAADDQRLVYVGDRLHRNNLSDARNVLEFTDQRYPATGQYFAPPSRLGRALAIRELPVPGRSDGMGMVVVSCENGLFGIFDNVFPRENWPSDAKVQVLAEDVSATGPYGFDVFSNDMMFRSSVGIHTLQSVEASSGTAGAQLIDLGREVERWLKSDKPHLLRFASLTHARDLSRTFCTVAPMVSGRNRWHGGFVVCNWNPISGAKPEGRSWEGLWTLPKALGGVSMFARDGVGQLYSLNHKWQERRNLVVKHFNEWRPDIDEDGTEIPISWQIETRTIAPDAFVGKSKIQGLFVRLLDVRGDFELETLIKTDADPSWRLMSKKAFKVGSNCHVTDVQNSGRDFWMLLVKEWDKPSRSFQILLRGKGHAVLGEIGLGKVERDRSDTESFTNVEGCYESNRQCSEGDDFETIWN